MNYKLERNSFVFIFCDDDDVQNSEKTLKRFLIVRQVKKNHFACVPDGIHFNITRNAIKFDCSDMNIMNTLSAVCVCSTSMVVSRNPVDKHGITYSVCVPVHVRVSREMALQWRKIAPYH